MTKLALSKEKFASVASKAALAQGGDLAVSNFLKISVVGNEVEATSINPDSLSIVAKEKLDDSVSESCSFLLERNKAKNIQLLKSEQVKITLEDDNTIKVGGDNGDEPSVWNTMDVSLYPQLPAISGTPKLTFTIGLDEFRTKYRFIKPGIASDQSRPVLCNILCIAEGTEIFFYSLDGFRMHVNVIEMPIACAQKTVFTIPVKLSDFIDKLKGDGNLTFSLYDQIISASYDDEVRNVMAFEKLVDGAAPDFRQIVSKSEFNLLINKSALVESVERLVAFTNNPSSTYLLMSVTSGLSRILLKMESDSEINTDTVNLEVAATKDLKIAFNQKFLMDALKSFSSDVEWLSLGFINELKPLTISPVIDGVVKEFPFSIVLPVRIAER